MKQSVLVCAAVTLLLSLVPCRQATAIPQTLIATDFSAADQPVHVLDAPNRKRIEGLVPTGWHDDSDFNKTIQVAYRVQSVAGKPTLRFINGGGGRAQLAHPLPDVTERGVYDLTLTARSPRRTSLEAGVRQSDVPYGFPYRVVLPLTTH